jgi:hypothetical protein
MRAERLSVPEVFEGKVIFLLRIGIGIGISTHEKSWKQNIAPDKNKTERIPIVKNTHIYFSNIRGKESGGLQQRKIMEI